MDDFTINRITARATVKLLAKSRVQLGRLLASLEAHISTCSAYGADEQFMREAREFLEELDEIL